MDSYYANFFKEQLVRDAGEIDKELVSIASRIFNSLLALKSDVLVSASPHKFFPNSLYKQDLVDLQAKLNLLLEKYPNFASIDLYINSLKYIDALTTTAQGLETSINLLGNNIESLMNKDKEMTGRIDILELENIVIKKKNDELEDRIAKLEQLVTPKPTQKNKNWRRKIRNKNTNQTGTQRKEWTKEAEDKYRCNTCKKAFSDVQYIEKHLNLKHSSQEFGKHH